MNELPFRRIHMDFHTSPFIGGIGDEFDANEFAKTLKDAYVNAIHLTAKCHHGMYYYPTKLGTVHPSLKFDLFGSQVEACRKQGISVIAYTPIVWNEDWASRHPEWLQVNIEGVLGNKKPFCSKDNSAENYGWRYLCINNRGLVEYTKSELKEIYDLYKPDAYWIDIIWQNRCVCSTCIKEMKEMGLNPEVTADVLKHDRFVEIKFMEEIYKYMKEIDINSELFFNSTTVEYDVADNKELSNQQKSNYMTYLDIESLPTEIWSYSHFPICVNYWNTHDIEIGMMNGKFHKSWGDFGSLRNIAALEYECFRALANGAKCCIGDQLHPSGKIDK
ncbi:MAG: alpha-L-fucosidase, partial [Ruminiclostridium sp.]